MLNEILALERRFDDLLATRRKHVTVPTELLEAGQNWSSAIWDAAVSMGKLQLTGQQVEDGLLFSQRPVFICGSERSGTTLIRNLLDAHPQLSVLPSEGTYITNQEKQLLALPAGERARFLCREWLWRLVTSMHHPPYFLLGRSSAGHSPYIEFARAFIAWWQVAEERLSGSNPLWPFIALQLAYATAQGKLDSLTTIYWAEKTPNNEMHMQRLFHAFPDARFIQAIRNPVDVIRSRKPFETVSTVDLTTSIRFLHRSFVIANRQRMSDNKKHMVVMYEELCEKPEHTAQLLASFIGIEFLSILLAPTVAGKPAQPNSSFKQEAIAGKIMSRKEHLQEDMLTPKDMRLLSAYLFRPAAKFGYRLQPIGFLQGQAIRTGILISRVMKKINRTISNR